MEQVSRPDWWPYPKQCANGHPWGPGRIIVSWEPCQCGPARAAQPRGSGHRVVLCRADGCRSVWYDPRHDPATVLSPGILCPAGPHRLTQISSRLFRGHHAPRPVAEATP